MPAMRISFRADTTAFIRSMDRYLGVITSSRTREELMKGQLKFLVRGVLDLTPPETLAQGRAAVRTDISRAMSVWGGEDGSFSGIRNDGLRERLQTYSRSGQYDKMKEVWAAIGAGSSVKLLDFSPELHHSVQNDRGRVPSSQGVMVPQRMEWRAYLAKIQGQVGRARGGWAAAAQMVGLTVPEWVSRHAAGGSATADYAGGRTTFTFTNRAIFIPRYAQNVELAISGRQKAMETEVRRFLQDAKTWAGLS